MEGRFVVYYRGSTADQGKSGLGLAAQRKTVEDFLNGNGYMIVGEYEEVESGKKNDRPELQKALKACRLKKARLIVSKLDRLSRDLHFITELQTSNVPFVIAEMPDATELTIHIYAALAQHERKVISRRTKDALAQLKAKGVKLGNPHLGKGKKPTPKMVAHPAGNTINANNVRIIKANKHAEDIAEEISEYRNSDPGASLRDIAEYLNESGYRTSRGADWSATAVLRVLKRVSANKPNVMLPVAVPSITTSHADLLDRLVKGYTRENDPAVMRVMFDDLMRLKPVDVRTARKIMAATITRESGKEIKSLPTRFVKKALYKLTAEGMLKTVVDIKARLGWMQHP